MDIKTVELHRAAHNALWDLATAVGFGVKQPTPFSNSEEIRDALSKARVACAAALGPNHFFDQVVAMAKESTST
jgi:hypothetical protein